jgi:hypothetical protein
VMGADGDTNELDETAGVGLGEPLCAARVEP